MDGHEKKKEKEKGADNKDCAHFLDVFCYVSVLFLWNILDH